jgi:hypothetical protein
MGNFLRQNWLYIAVPLALVLLGIAVFLLFFANGSLSNGDVYPIF